MTAAALITAALIVFLIRRARPLAANPQLETRRIFAEHVIDLVSTHSQDGTFRYVSPVFAGMLGEYPGTLTGKHPAAYAHPDDVNALTGMFKRAIVWTGAPTSTTWRCRRHDGDYAWLETSARVSGEDTRELGAIICASRDITERKQIEDALRDSEQRFRTTVETVRLVAVGLDTSGVVTFCNDALCSLTGWSRAELMGENWFDKCVPPGDHTRALFFDHMPLGDVPLKDEGEILCRDHTRRMISWDHTVLRTALGDVLGTASLGVDVTEARREEAALKLLHSISLSISASHDLNEALQRTLDSLCEATGWTYGDAWLPSDDGQRLRRSTYHVHPDVSCEPFLAAGAGSALVSGEGLPGRAWASKSIEWIQDLSSVNAVEFPRLALASQCGFKSAVAVPVLSGEEVVAVLGFFMDSPRAIDERHTQMIFVVANQVGAIIERRRAQTRYEAEILRARDEAEAASHAKSDFLSRMSHELRTPLNSVIGFANVLRKNKAGRLATEDVAFLDRITANGRHLLTLVNNVLDIAKVEAGRLTVTSGIVAVDELVRSVADQIEGQPRDPSVQLRVDVPEDMLPIETDGVLLKQVLINLVSNALRFTHEGSVVIAVEQQSGHPARIRVRDTGIGIDQERQQAIFEPFEQADEATHRKYGGTGLGLSIAKAICDALDFGLTLESTPGRGSTFTIHLIGGRSRHGSVSDSDRAVPKSDKSLPSESVAKSTEPQPS